ncbi:adenine nucleotide alpha hydrolases-like protein, partial [Melanomma pulvis-pyrius CBS 109.77]
SSLKVIALVSGGKDSFYSILHCLAAGHTVVALANLYPPIPADGLEHEDLNSFMYQTVGHSVIPLYEKATGIPLFRQEIRGDAVNSERDYAAPAVTLGLDETESLVPLIARIKNAHPEVNAISTGAILSTYQRTRVESVALRLGLTPLSFLWQYPLLPPYSQSALLHDMRAVGQDSRIIKVASGGLDETFLWQNVADSKTISRLGKAIARFCDNGDGAVLGEGGEFETLAIDGPDVLWKKKIEIEPDRVILGGGGEAIWEGKAARLVKKEGERVGLKSLRIPYLWDDEFEEVLASLETLPEPTLPNTAAEPIVPAGASHLKITNMHYKGDWSITLSAQVYEGDLPLDPPAQLASILHSAVNTLAGDDLDTTDILHTTLILRNMSDFSAVNEIYGPFFTSPNPPSRVTVACGDRLPSGVDVMLSVIAAKKLPILKTYRELGEQPGGLHVQSRSYWAPANIGPYSQAIATPLIPESDSVSCSTELVFVAGQIPLIPGSMEVYTEHGFKGQALLALQHLFRIGRAMHVGRWVAGVAFMSTCPDQETYQRVQTAQTAWTAIHTAPPLPEHDDDAASDAEEAQVTDPWDMLNIRGPLVFDDTTNREPLPDPSMIIADENTAIPPCFVVQVAQLPRDAPIEWSALGLAKGTLTSEMVFHQPRVFYTDVKDSKVRFIALEVTDDWNEVPTLIRTGVWDHCTLYAGPDFPDNWGSLKGVSYVPCQAVWGHGGKKVRGVLVGR